MPAGEIFVDIYADHGCSYAPSCLNCPFEVCRYDRGFAGNRVSKAMSRLDRDDKIIAMRAKGMQVEEIAAACGVSGRTVARILSRKGPSRSDVKIVRQYDAEADEAAAARANGQQAALDAMGIKPRSPLPKLRLSASPTPIRSIYSSAPEASGEGRNLEKAG